MAFRSIHDKVYFGRKERGREQLQQGKEEEATKQHLPILPDARWIEAIFAGLGRLGRYAWGDATYLFVA